jgi:hypothetical protein
MTSGPPPDCMGCMYYHSVDFSGLNCDAYPKGIPEGIIMGDKHHKVRKDQVGEVVYKKFEIEEWRKLNPEE